MYHRPDPYQRSQTGRPPPAGLHVPPYQFVPAYQAYPQHPHNPGSYIPAAGSYGHASQQYTAVRSERPLPARPADRHAPPTPPSNPYDISKYLPHRFNPLNGGTPVMTTHHNQGGYNYRQPMQQAPIPQHYPQYHQVYQPPPPHYPAQPRFSQAPNGYNRPHVAAVAPKRKKFDFFCDSCSKGFECEEDYDIHVAEDHVTCSHPGCGFNAREEVVRAHKLKHAVNVDSPEEIEAWLAMRRNKFPRKNIDDTPKDASSPLQLSKLEKFIRNSMRQSAIEARKRRREREEKQPCVHWERSGKCSYGDKCSFAHEKTGVCTFFLNHGRCRHGDSCKYKHVRTGSRELEEIRDPRGQLLKKLMAPEIHKFQSTMLQCIRHIVNNGFYQGTVETQCEPEEFVEEEDAFSSDHEDDDQEIYSPISASRAMVSVHKFGGTSVAGPEQFSLVSRIIKDSWDSQPTGPPPVVVVSAMAGITNKLYSAIQAAVVVGDYEAILNEIKTTHFKCIDKLFVSQKNFVELLEKGIEDDIERIRKLLETVTVFGGTCPIEISDIVAGFGEIWSSRILAQLLVSLETPARAVNARDFLFLSSSSGKDVRIDWNRSVAPICGSEILVITGFLATSSSGVPTTLKRNGSDFSGAIVANLFNASQLTIWTDVDGIYSADPRQIVGAKMITEMSYKEAAELAYFGAKVIHPQTMAPCVVKRIPIVLRNTFNLQCPGTLISGDSILAARAVTMIPEIALINVEGSGLFGFSGIAAKLFSAVAAAESNIIMITQASSEYSICFAVPIGDAEICAAAVRKTFASEIFEKSIDVTLDTTSCIIAAVGDNMHQQIGLLGRLTSALGSGGINIRAVAQGSSERNITLVVNKADGIKGLQALHDAL